MDLFPHARWRPHPWHGLEVGPDPPGRVNAYIEITPFDLVKYEIDKETGYLRVDRPQRTSSLPPLLYGFIPRTYCGDRVGALTPRADHGGDGDPMDICVISERPIAKSEVILVAKVIGGLQLVDNGHADDKIIAVLEKDPFWDHVADVSEVPPALVDRLQHYFSTYKEVPGEKMQITLEKLYGREEALQVVKASIQDYQETFGNRQKGGLV